MAGAEISAQTDTTSLVDVVEGLGEREAAEAAYQVLLQSNRLQVATWVVKPAPGHEPLNAVQYDTESGDEPEVVGHRLVTEDEPFDAADYDETRTNYSNGSYLIGLVFRDKEPRSLSAYDHLPHRARPDSTHWELQVPIGRLYEHEVTVVELGYDGEQLGEFPPTTPA